MFFFLINCAQLLGDLFLYSHECSVYIIKKNSKTTQLEKITPVISHSGIYTDNVLSINHLNLDTVNIYYKEHEVKKKQKQLPLPHFLTFTSNLTKTVHQIL